ncbi:hypothetical protein B0H14DRAFT_2626378 [Mycena olivaceomarginata]|nr:hypothetical protein B0H14DRAFT_2626378 [Mycena olivaceomarginata]
MRKLSNATTTTRIITLISPDEIYDKLTEGTLFTARISLETFIMKEKINPNLLDNREDFVLSRAKLQTMRQCWLLVRASQPASNTVTQPFIIYVFEYDSWRRALPKEDYEKAPLLKGISKSSETRSQLTDCLSQCFMDPPRKNENEADANSKFFFWTRWIPVADDSSKEDYPDMAQETDIDRSHRDELIALIKRRNDFSADKTRLRFESVKHVHPFHDPLTGVSVTSIIPFLPVLILRV